MKREIIASYKKLIKNCRVQITKNIEVEKNLQLIKEYQNILNEVLNKPAKDYEILMLEMKKSSK